MYWQNKAVNKFTFQIYVLQHFFHIRQSKITMKKSHVWLYGLHFLQIWIHWSFFEDHLTKGVIYSFEHALKLYSTLYAKVVHITRCFTRQFSPKTRLYSCNSSNLLLLKMDTRSQSTSVTCPELIRLSGAEWPKT